ncbi:hypothetical protein AAHA92_15335 [Salvia divinorum]|uniref:Uncharacterized protein n=1 Tax=Salvia divinorum TaxID=28513 RepID=A0ABD1HF86_SALDI
MSSTILVLFREIWRISKTVIVLERKKQRRFCHSRPCTVEDPLPSTPTRSRSAAQSLPRICGAAPFLRPAVASVATSRCCAQAVAIVAGVSQLARCPVLSNGVPSLARDAASANADIKFTEESDELERRLWSNFGAYWGGQRRLFLLPLCILFCIFSF